MDKRTAHRIVRDLVLHGEHKAAFLVTNIHCEDDRNFIDGIVLWYCNNRGNVMPIPPVSAYNFAGPYVHLASPRVARSFVQDLVGLGMAERAEDAALNFLRRDLTEEEVRELVGHHVNGTGIAGNDERKLVELAYRTGGHALKDWADGCIEELHLRQRQAPDL